MKKIKEYFTVEKMGNVYASLLAILAGLLFGLIILVAVKPDEAFPAFGNLFTAGFTNLGNVAFYATPIILTGLSIAFAFKTGLFNIGAPGQLLVGGYVAILIGVRATFFGPFTWVVAVIGAILAGALWSFIPALLKAYRGVHEVVTTIMMNYISLYFVNFLIKKTVYYSDQNHTLPVTKIIPKFGLDKIFPNSHIQGGFLLAILAVVIIYIILEKTTFGFELKAVGYNMEASRYAGIDEKKRSVYSLLIAGAISGLAGAVLYLSDSRTFIVVDDSLPSQGFLGISVALLASNNPIGVVLSALFFGYLTIGGESMQLFSFSPEIIDVIIGVIIYFSALSMMFIRLINRIVKRRKERDKV